MSYFSNVGFKQPNSDPFGRLRVSMPYTVLDLKQLRDALPLFFSDVGTGAGYSNYLTNQAASRIGVSVAAVGSRVRQSKLRGVYQTGKGLLIESTFNFHGGTLGMTKEAGYFDNQNGIGIRLKGTDVYSFVRSYVTGTAVDVEVPQSAWNLDRFDGTGPSGISLDLTKAQIGGIDFQWLGVGRVREALNIDGNQYYFHEYNNANNSEAVYMSNPNLPVRYGVSCDAATAGGHMDCICASIVSEGGQEDVSQPTIIDRDVTPIAISNTSFSPVISVRLKSDAFPVRATPQGVELYTDDTCSYAWKLLLNPAIAGVDAASWQSVIASGLQYDVSRTTVNEVTGGYKLASGYGSSSNQVKQAASALVKSFLTMGFNASDVSDEMVLAARRMSGPSANLLGVLSFGEKS